MICIVKTITVMGMVYIHIRNFRIPTQKNLDQRAGGWQGKMVGNYVRMAGLIALNAPRNRAERRVKVMQETIPKFDSDGNILDENVVREFFEGETDEKIFNKMENRLKELEGHKLITRRKIGPNELCPCMSGKKFEKCCMAKVAPTDE